MLFGAQGWTVTPSPRPAAPLKLVCFHHSGGGALGFRDWPAMLRPDVELIAVQLPGRENRYSDPPVGGLDALLDAFVPALRDLVRGPYALFGHSLGGALAYFLAERVARTAEMAAPVRLIVSATPPPMANPLGKARPPLTDAELVGRLRRLGGTPPELLEEPSMLAAFLPTLRADFELMAGLPPAGRTPLDVAITAIRGASDQAVDASDFEGWSRLTSNAFRSHTLPGGHFYFQTAQAEFFQILNTVLGYDLGRLPAAAVQADREPSHANAG